MTPRGTNEVVTDYIKTYIDLNQAASMQVDRDNKSKDSAKKQVRAPRVQSSSKLLSSGKKGPRVFV